MTPREFLDQVVRPTVADFHAKDASIRHAFAAVAATDALPAYIFYARQTVLAKNSKYDDTSYREDLADEDANFRLLRDLAKAIKHFRLERGSPVVQTAATVTSRKIGYGQGAYGAGKYGGPRQVVVDVGPNDFGYVGNVVDKALEFLEAKMQTLSL